MIYAEKKPAILRINTENNRFFLRIKPQTFVSSSFSKTFILLIFKQLSVFLLILQSAKVVKLLKYTQKFCFSGRDCTQISVQQAVLRLPAVMKMLPFGKAAQRKQTCYAKRKHPPSF